MSETKVRGAGRMSNTAWLAVISLIILVGAFVITPMAPLVTTTQLLVVVALLCSAVFFLLAATHFYLGRAKEREKNRRLQEDFDEFKQLYADALPIQLILALREPVNLMYGNGGWVKLEWPSLNPVHSNTEYLNLINSLVVEHGATKIISKAKIGLPPFELTNSLAGQRAFIAKLLQKAVMPPSS